MQPVTPILSTHWVCLSEIPVAMSSQAATGQWVPDPVVVLCRAPCVWKQGLGAWSVYSWLLAPPSSAMGKKAPQTAQGWATKCPNYGPRVSSSAQKEKPQKSYKKEKKTTSLNLSSIYIFCIHRLYHHRSLSFPPFLRWEKRRNLHTTLASIAVLYEALRIGLKAFNKALTCARFFFFLMLFHC